MTDTLAFNGQQANIIVGDFNGDGKDDLIRQEFGSSADGYRDTEVYLSNGDGTFANPLPMTDMAAFNGQQARIIVGDFNGDAKDDLIRQEFGSLVDGYRDTEIYLSNGDGTFGLPLPMTDMASFNGQYTNIIVGDFNADAKDDLIRQEFGGWIDGSRDTEVYLAGELLLGEGKYKAEYYHNISLSGTPYLITFEDGLNFNWGDGSPADGINNDNFSIRWTGTNYFEGGLYNFISQADDGVRIFIHGVKVIDRWVDQPYLRNDAYVNIPPGYHEVVVEYFERAGSAAHNLNWDQLLATSDWTGGILPVGYDGSAVHSTYVNTFQRNDEATLLGAPINKVHPWENGYTQDFDGGADGRGAIMKSNANDNSYWVGGEVWQKFLDLGGAKSLGYPTTDYIDINGGLNNLDNGGGIVQHFSGNEGIPSKIWLSKHGAHPTWGAIAGKYEALDATNSFLGFPTSREIGIGGDRIVQNFVGGTILYKFGQPTVAYSTDFWNKYQEAQAWDGLLGYATSEAFNTKDGQRQNFQGGAILKSDAGIFTIYGGIGAKYISLGAENSFLGFPTSGETGIGDGWIIQSFQGGDILYKEGQPTVVYDSNAINSLPPGSGNGSTSPWVVQYWNNQNMIGNPIFTRADEPGEIRFAAGAGAPPDTTGIKEDNFSIRWTTNSSFDGGLYNFISSADDGVRVYIDGVKVIDKWAAIEPGSRQDGYILIPQGKHQIIVEYFEQEGNAALHFKWENSNLVNNWTGALLPVGYDGGSVHSTYVNTYQRNGDISELGYPLNNVHPWENGYTQDFDGGADGRGAIMKSNANDNSYWVGGEVWQKFLDLGAAKSLGYPTTDYIDINGGLNNLDNGGGIVQHFSGNEGIPTKIWLSKHGAHPTWGAIAGKYEALDATNSFLGFPTSREIGIGGDRIVQNFVGGTILYKFGQPTVAYSTDFWNKYQEAKAWDGLLGYATSEAFNTKDGQRQNFQGGAILKSDAGIFTIYGGIGAKYISLGAENSFLGFPITSEVGIGDGWIIQHFQGGEILYKEGQPTVAYDSNAINSLPPDSGNGSTSPWVVQYWNNQNMIGNPIFTRADDPGEIRFAAGAGAPPDTRGIKEDNISIRWVTNSFFEGGIYNFISQADDGIRVYVNDVKIIDKWQEQSFVTNTQPVFVKPGYNTVRVEYFENLGNAINTLRWEELHSLDEWIGEFYNNRNLAGNAVGYTSAGTGFLDKNWGLGREPGIPIGNDNFSDRWTTIPYFQAGAYEFVNTSDDGVRLWINDKLVLDQWYDQPSVTSKAIVSLNEGYHKIRLEHFENTGAAVTQLFWEETGIEPNLFFQPIEGSAIDQIDASDYLEEPWVGEYFNNRSLAGAPVFTRMDGAGTSGKDLNFDWGLDSPDSRINSDDFSARWTTNSYLQGAGNYTFSVTGDDGVRLYINGVKILDKWQAQPFITNSATINLGEGLHQIQLEYFELGGNAAVNLDWVLNSSKLTYEPATEISSTLNETKVNPTFKSAYDAAVNTLSASVVGVPLNTIRTEEKGVPIGKIQEFLGTQGKFALLQEIGSPNITYAWGKILDAYQQFGSAAVLGYPVASQKDLGNGAYELALPNGKFFFAPGMSNPTYYEYVNGSLTIPADSWKAELFNNTTWSGNPVFVSGSINPNQYWGANSPAPGVNADNFSVRWTSQKPFDRGTYRFTGTHDDDFQVTVNGQSPINRTGVGFEIQGYGTFTQASQYLVEAKFVEYGGLAAVNLSYDKASDYIVGLDSNNNPHQKILDTFWEQGGYDRVGVPVNDVKTWFGFDLVQDFKGGANGDGIIIRQDINSEAYYVYGDIWRVYLENQNVPLGYPTSNVFDDGHGNIAQNFGDRRITRRGNGETFIGGYVNGYRLDGEFFWVWNQYKLGTPTSNVQTHSSGAKFHYFNHPTLGTVSAVQSQYGTFPLWGGIRDYYVNKAGGLGGVLGAPKSTEYSWDGKTRQDFAGGYILWNGSAIGYKPDGSLLFPPPNSGNGNNPGSGPGITYDQYLYLLYRDNIGNKINQTYEEHGDAIDSEDGDPDGKVYALAGGQVKFIGKDQFGGNYIQIWNSQLQRNFFYVHFSNFNSSLKVNQKIEQGHFLGIEGSTGKSTGVHTHVHVTTPNGTRENPLITLGTLQNQVTSSPNTPPVEPESPPLNNVNDQAGNTLNLARWLGTLADNNNYNYRDWVGKTDTNDYYKFQLEERSAFTVWLDDPSKNNPYADIELINSNNQVIRSSLFNNVDAVDEYLDAGTYYIRVLPSFNNAETYYNLNLAVKHTWGRIGISKKGDIRRGGLERIDGSAWITNNTTWIISHGMDSSPSADNINKLALAIDGYQTGDQVFVLNWSEAAKSGNFPVGLLSPFPNVGIGASWIEAAAKFATNKLISWGISAKNINLAGHSLGSYVSYEIAKEISKEGKIDNISKLIALDPARQVIGGYETKDIEFSDYTDWSWGFYGSLLGSDTKAKTADESFKFDFGERDPEKHHGAVVNAFANMLEKNNKGTAGKVSSLFALNRMNNYNKPWKTHNGFEAVLYPKEQSNGEWMPDRLEYYKGGWDGAWNWPDIYEI
ncbi:PA14 domain-containing protein [Nodularia sp. LEGE 04288]|uniref:PA14 domain-containing protein n=1 Tax=Nodularia sp. LEGE 04288 TaxID=1828639 RepID=UPI001D10830D|nr:PA14 domain-containing protein [Nodularia sp. LEGE 04288]